MYSQLTCNCSKSIIQSFLIFCKSRVNSLQCNKAKGSTKTNSKNINKQSLSFDAKLIYSCKLIKIHFSFTKINARKNFEKLSLAKINPRQNLSVQGKTYASVSVAWLIRTCLHFESLKNVGLGKRVVLINWSCCNKYVHSTGYPDSVLHRQKYFGMKCKKKKKGKIKQILDFIIRYSRYHIVTTNEDKRKWRFASIVSVTW